MLHGCRVFANRDLRCLVFICFFSSFDIVMPLPPSPPIFQSPIPPVKQKRNQVLSLDEVCGLCGKRTCIQHDIKVAAHHRNSTSTQYLPPKSDERGVAGSWWCGVPMYVAVAVGLLLGVPCSLPWVCSAKPKTRPVGLGRAPSWLPALLATIEVQ